MSPPTSGPKFSPNKPLRKSGSVVGRKLDSKISISAPQMAEIKAPDLAEIVTLWPSLAEHIKAAIKALIRMSQDHTEAKKR
jgi:hypothetical protein